MSENDTFFTKLESEIPRGWAACELSDAVIPSRPRGKPEDFVGQPFIGLEHIEAHTTRMLGFVPAESMRSSGVVFNEGDVLYSRMRPYLNKVWFADRSGLCSGEFIVFPDTGALKGKYLKYRLNASDFVSFTDHGTTGDRPRADFDDFGKFPVLVPPANEQERIADRIEELFTDLDAGIAALERVKRNLSRYRAAVLHAAVTGRLTEEWRKKHGPPEEPASELLKRILEERRKQWEEKTLAGYEAKGKKPPKNWKWRYKEPEKPKLKINEDDLHEIPADWCWASMHQLMLDTPQNGVYKPKDQYGSGHSILRIDDFQSWWIRKRSELQCLQLAESEIVAYCLNLGDIVINRVNSMTHLGKCALISSEYEGAVFESNMMRCALTQLINSEWIQLTLTEPTGQARLTQDAKWAVNQASINQTDVSITAVPVPPSDEVPEILLLASEQLSKIDAMEAEVKRGLSRSSRLRQSILKAAFEGKLVPQNPNDEPASVLLERIREQAAKAPKTKRKTRKKSSRKAATT